jgi:hypothetical protein
MKTTAVVLALIAGSVTDAAAQKLPPIGGPYPPPFTEMYLAVRNIGGSGLFYKKDRLFLQFRKGRLAGWKGDWGHNWMWQ